MVKYFCRSRTYNKVDHIWSGWLLHKYIPHNIFLFKFNNGKIGKRFCCFYCFSVEKCLKKSLSNKWKSLIKNIPIFKKIFGQSTTLESCTAQKMKFSTKDFFSKCGQKKSFLRIWSHLLKKSLMGNFIFCTALPNISDGYFCENS